MSVDEQAKAVIAFRGDDTSPKGAIRFFWQNGCSSCQNTKEFLLKRNVEFESVNLSDQPERLSEVTDRGFRAVPVIMDDNRAMIAQDLKFVAEFVGISYEVNQLQPEVLAEKMLSILTSAIDNTAIIPTDSLRSGLDGRDRAHSDLIHHIFRVVESFTEQADEANPKEGSLEVFPSDDVTTEDLVSYGSSVRGKFQSWWEQSDRDGARMMGTFDGVKPMNDVFERATWHAAHHSRQLEKLVLKQLDLAPPNPMSEQTLKDLRLPETLF